MQLILHNGTTNPYNPVQQAIRGATNQYRYEYLTCNRLACYRLVHYTQGDVEPKVGRSIGHADYPVQVLLKVDGTIFR